MPTYATAMASVPQTVVSFGTALQSANTQLTSVQGRFQSQTSSLSAHWKGEAHDKQAEKAKDAVDRFGDVSRKVSQASQAAVQGGIQMQAIVMALRIYTQVIMGQGFLVLPPLGTVMPGPVHYSQAAAAGPGAPGVMAAYQAMATYYSTQIALQVTRLTTVDLQTTQRLEALAIQISRNPDAQNLPLGTDWVNSLSDADRASFHRLHAATGRARARSAQEFIDSMKNTGESGGRYWAGRARPDLRSRFTGSDIENAIRDDDLITGDPNITHTGSGRGSSARPDFTIGGQHGIDVTGGSRSSINTHMGRDYYDSHGQMITYPSLTDDFLNRIYR